MAHQHNSQVSVSVDEGKEAYPFYVANDGDQHRIIAT
jgi:hypothetical protein